MPDPTQETLRIEGIIKTGDKTELIGELNKISGQNLQNAFNTVNESTPLNAALSKLPQDKLNTVFNEMNHAAEKLRPIFIKLDDETLMKSVFNEITEPNQLITALKAAYTMTGGGRRKCRRTKRKGRKGKKSRKH
jgi:hypothetical protein